MNLNSVPRFPLTTDRKPQPGQPVNIGDLTSALHDQAARRRLLTWFNTEVANDTLLRRQNWPIGVAALGVIALSALALWTLGAFLTAMIAAATSGGRHTGLWLHHSALTRTITDPLRAWVDTHTAGSPATSTDLALAWLVVAAVLYLAALTGSTYARVAWALTGAAITTAAYAGAAHTGALVAAGTTAGAWLLLSLPIYRRRRNHHIVTADNTTR